MTSKKRADLRNVYIALTCQDLGEFLTLVTQRDIILTDLYCPAHAGQTMQPILPQNEEALLVKDVSNWFKAHCHDSEKAILYGYVNNFYECSLRPIVGYLYALDKIIEDADSKNILFHLPRKMAWDTDTSTYFMAEHESRGIHFYDRDSMLLPYIKRLLIQRQCAILQGSLKAPRQKWLLNPIRAAAVYLGRLYTDIRHALVSKKQAVITASDQISQTFIVRTIGQASTIIPYLANTSHNALVIVSSSYSDHGAADMLNKIVGHRKNILIWQSRPTAISFILKTYLKTLFLLTQRNDAFYTYKDIKIDLRQSFREMLIMSASLKLYNDQIVDTLRNIDISTVNFIFSLEQKSPQAFVDTKIAADKNIPSAQIKQCNQSYRPLPNPVCASYFFCDNTEVQKSFQECWPDLDHKIKYVGSFQGISNANSANNTMKGANILQICLFGGVFHEDNTETIEFLQAALKTLKIKLTVKLHPRDRKNYSKKFPDVAFLQTQLGDFSEFYEKFDIVITYPSSVVSDLIFTKVPFIIYVPNRKEYNIDLKDMVPKGIKCVKTLAELSQCFNNVDKLINEHTIARERLLSDIGVITKIEQIEANIKALSIEKSKEYFD